MYVLLIFTKILIGSLKGLLVMKREKVVVTNLVGLHDTKNIR
jgi:hypothetical protein